MKRHLPHMLYVFDSNEIPLDINRMLTTYRTNYRCRHSSCCSCVSCYSFGSHCRLSSGSNCEPRIREVSRQLRVPSNIWTTSRHLRPAIWLFSARRSHWSPTYFSTTHQPIAQVRYWQKNMDIGILLLVFSEAGPDFKCVLTPSNVVKRVA